MYSYKESAEEEPLQPFESFVCPLTKQIMKDPVMIQSELTYERSAIERWFKTCAEEGRSVTCPATGVLLASTEMRSNIMLRHTIEEWCQRNARIRIHKALSQLSKSSSMKSLAGVEEALDSILKVCGDGPVTQYRLGKSHFTSSVLEFWRKRVAGGSQVRTKALYILQRIAADDIDSQECLVEAGVLKAAVRSLSSSHVYEVEGALKLLLEISKKPEFAKLIGKEKGALIHLLGISSNSSGNASLSVLADRTLRNLEQIDSNVWEMAEAGRLEPLITRLCKGTDTTKIEMAEYLAEKIFVNSQKEFVARKAGKVLVHMLSANSMQKEAAIGALLNLSSLEENVPVLVKAGILLPVVEIILSVPTSSNRLRGNSKEQAATTLANVVAVAGSWETVQIDSEGNLVQSEYFVHRLLGLLSSVGPDWNSKLLKILIGVASSPQAADNAVKHVVTGNGIAIILTLLQTSDDAHRQHLLSLLSVLSVRAGREISQAIAETRHLQSLKEIVKLKNAEESIFAASIIANIPLTEHETINFLGLEMISWSLATIEELKTRRMGSARVTSSMLEALLGVLLHFTRCRDSQAIDAMKQSKLFSQFKQVLQLHQGRAWVAKQRAATGLGYLSERGLILSPEVMASSSFRRKNNWMDNLFSCFSSKNSSLDQAILADSVCSIHKRRCDPDANFCLREAGAIGLLVELLEEDEEQASVQIAAVEALSTLVSSDSLVEAGVREISRARGVAAFMKWFQTQRSGEAQEKGAFLVERILRVEEHARLYSLDQGLIRALVEVFKHGRNGARKNAEAALAHTDMLSVVSGKSSKNRR
ncbi:hypothetical protein SELMODRAFT_165881 [Selaginella moellendorffii]|uniref:RING-type E3 ubiquitin transferase n=1 Tax=Selaginella moellendorffii TaxID=88036 RepID=D8QXP7_SELML|nr:hypothetical protein SELMODRAFT_165881 [Selaginella moellendorffii]